MLKKHFTVLMTLTAFQLMSTSVLAAPVELKPAALECYNQAMSEPKIFKMNKGYKTPDAVEKMAVSLCTYSDAEGSMKCYLQASEQAEVLPANKDYLNIFALEQKYARLCSNSGKNLMNKTTGDMDAIECFKAVTSDPTVLTAAKAYMNNVDIEDLAIKLCISSNALGATQCYAKSIDRANEILSSATEYRGAAALDQIIVDLCKGSRIR